MAKRTGWRAWSQHLHSLYRSLFFFRYVQYNATWINDSTTPYSTIYSR
jgi:hypothetical protein